jgi:hypothetical protein
MPKVQDSMYTENFGRRPRGRRTYSFVPGDGNGNAHWNVSVYLFNGTYSDARRAAKKHFGAYPEVHVF